MLELVMVAALLVGAVRSLRAQRRWQSCGPLVAAYLVIADGAAALASHQRGVHVYDLGTIVMRVLSLAFLGPGAWSERSACLPLPHLLLEQTWLEHTIQTTLVVSLAAASWYHVSLQSPLLVRTEQLAKITTSLVGAAILKLLEGLLLTFAAILAHRS